MNFNFRYARQSGAYLWPGVPEPHHRVNATGCQKTVAGVGLQAVHYGLVTLQNAHQVGRLLLPDEEGAII